METSLGVAACGQSSAFTQFLLWKSCSGLDVIKNLLKMLVPVSAPSQRLTIPESLS